MESLVNYGSDDECGDYNEWTKDDTQVKEKIEEDANYDEVGMDESSEESNNNHAEGHFSAATREKQEGTITSRLNSAKGMKDGPSGQLLDGSISESDSNSNSRFEDESSISSIKANYKREHEKWDDAEIKESEEGRKKENVKKFKDVGHFGMKNIQSKDLKEESSLKKIRSVDFDTSKPVVYPLGYSSKKNEDTVRRHSSDMEMDDGEDDFNNYKTEGYKFSETAANFRQQFMPKSINFTKGKDLGTESSRKFEENYQSSNAHSNSISEKNLTHSWDSKSGESEKNSNADDIQRSKEEKAKRERGRDSEDRRKEDHRRRDDRDGRKRDDDRWRENERDRRRENEKHREDRRRSPDRRKRSHSPERRDKDRDYDRDRDRDRDRERDRDRDRERERDRDREYRSGDRRSPKHSRRSSRSPDRSWKVRKFEKKAAVLNKLGIELKADVISNMTPRQLLGEQLKAQIQEVEAKTGVTLPTYYNPGVMNPLKYAQQIQKRKLLWGNKSNEAKTNESTGQGSSVPSTVKQWEAATFKGDSDGKMTEKFKRLMGIKGDSSAGNVGSSKSKPPETKEIIQKQEEMFSNMEAQYQVARMATHTHRGVGLGFGTFQVPPR